jgi:hypothetical protein
MEKYTINTKIKKKRRHEKVGVFTVQLVTVLR